MHSKDSAALRRQPSHGVVVAVESALRQLTVMDPPRMALILWIGQRLWMTGLAALTVMFMASRIRKVLLPRRVFGCLHWEVMSIMTSMLPHRPPSSWRAWVVEALAMV